MANPRVPLRCRGQGCIDQFDFHYADEKAAGFPASWFQSWNVLTAIDAGFISIENPGRVGGM
jgi:hypothetical protein